MPLQPAALKGRSFWEIACVILTGIVFLVFENVFHLKLVFLVPCIATWSTYIAWRLGKDPALSEAWGLRSKALWPASKRCLIFLVVGALLLFGYRVLLGWRPLSQEAFLLFLLYPIWAFIQQFVVQALVAVNLERLGFRRAVVIPASATLFGIVHMPDWPLVLLCAIAGLFWTHLFLRRRSLYPLAVTHAWLGVLTYYWVLERDPWLELFSFG